MFRIKDVFQVFKFQTHKFRETVHFVENTINVFGGNSRQFSNEILDDRVELFSVIFINDINADELGGK